MTTIRQEREAVAGHACPLCGARRKFPCMTSYPSGAPRKLIHPHQERIDASTGVIPRAEAMRAVADYLLGKLSGDPYVIAGTNSLSEGDVKRIERAIADTRRHIEKGWWVLEWKGVMTGGWTTASAPSRRARTACVTSWRRKASAPLAIRQGSTLGSCYTEHGKEEGSMQLSARNADMNDVVAILSDQRARRLDLIVPPSLITAHQGNLVVMDTEATRIIDADGVTSAAGMYRPADIADEGLGAKLGIPPAYLKKLRMARPDLWDANVNGWLHGGGAEEIPLILYGEDGSLSELPDPEPGYPPYGKNLLLRLLKGDSSDDGVLRAVLSPSYKFIDNLDVLLAVLQGVRSAGLEVIPGRCDLTDRRMHVRLEVPQVNATAPKLLEGYRSPFEGNGAARRAGSDLPGYRMRSEYIPRHLIPEGARAGHVFAGLNISNSDTGGGARTITPEIRILECTNGLTLVKSADRAVHLGSAQDEGVVEWSADTQEKELSLITSQTQDAVRTFLDEEWFRRVVSEIEALAGVPVPEPEETVRRVANAAGFTKGEAEGILQHFCRAGQYTSGGVANAVTSYSQTLANADRAADLDRYAVKAMELAARS